jgi:6-phosphogluconate dehydrogenase
MLPSGEITEQAVMQLGDMLQSGDIIIDGGNSFYKDDIRRAKTLNTKGIRHVELRHERRLSGVSSAATA